MNLVGDTIPSIDNPSLEYFPGILADGDSGLGIYKRSKAQSRAGTMVGAGWGGCHSSAGDR